MKKLIDKINIEKIADGFYLIDKGISLILNIVIVILIILVGVKSYSIEKYLNNNKEAIANYKWSISSIDFTNNISKDKNITKLGDKSIGKSLLAGKMIKSGIALLTVATVAGELWQYLI